MKHRPYSAIPGQSSLRLQLLSSGLLGRRIPSLSPDLCLSDGSREDSHSSLSLPCSLPSSAMTRYLFRKNIAVSYSCECLAHALLSHRLLPKSTDQESLTILEPFNLTATCAAADTRLEGEGGKRRGSQPPLSPLTSPKPQTSLGVGFASSPPPPGFVFFPFLFSLFSSGELFFWEMGRREFGWREGGREGGGERRGGYLPPPPPNPNSSTASSCNDQMAKCDADSACLLESPVSVRVT